MQKFQFCLKVAVFEELFSLRNSIEKILLLVQGFRAEFYTIHSCNSILTAGYRGKGIKFSVLGQRCYELQGKFNN